MSIIFKLNTWIYAWTKIILIATGILILLAIIIIVIIEATTGSQGLELSLFGDLLG